MSDAAHDNEIDGDTQEHIRVVVRRVAGGRPMTEIARETGIAYGTFTSWMGSTYAGNTSKIAAAAQRWIDAQEAASRNRASMPAAPSYVPTPTTNAIISTLEFAQFTPDLVMVGGGAGIGKTTAIQRHRATNPNVFILTGEPCFATPRMLLDSLAEVLDISERYSSQKVSRAIQKRLRGVGGLIVVDEAQHLSSTSLDQMRTLHDLA